MDEELKNILDEISQNRKSYKDDMKSNGNFNDFVVNMDFASLYPNQWWNVNPIPNKVIIRKTRIKRIFQ
jgi:DNA polymerase elongation subunit (family B)